MTGTALLLLSTLAVIYGCQAKALFEGVANIEHLNQENFEKKVVKSEKAWLVSFFDLKSDAAKDSVPEIEKLAKILAGIAKIGVVDISANEKLAADYDAKEPAIILFGADKTKPTLYKDKVKSEQLIKKVGAHVKAMIRAKDEKGESNPKKDVIKLTDENFQKKVLDSDGIWFVKYYDPNCAHSKAFAPEYAKAAAALKGSVNFGAVNMDVEVYDKMGAPYDIDKVPTIKIFGVDKVKPAEYSGPRKSTGLIERAMEEMEKLVKKRLGIAVGKNAEDLYGATDEQADEEDEDEKKDDKLTDATKVKKEKEEKKKEEKKDKEDKKKEEKKEDKKDKKDKKEDKKKDKEEKKEKKEKKGDKKESKDEL